MPAYERRQTRGGELVQLINGSGRARRGDKWHVTPRSVWSSALSGFVGGPPHDDRS